MICMGARLSLSGSERCAKSGGSSRTSALVPLSPSSRLFVSLVLNKSIDHADEVGLEGVQIFGRFP